jgi:hypothetical protein
LLVIIEDLSVVEGLVAMQVPSVFDVFVLDDLLVLEGLFGGMLLLSFLYLMV